MSVLHSGLSDALRAQIWQEAAQGDVRLLIGTRSALFAPLPRLGLIIVDEEHDLSYKQLSQIRYSARGAAFMRIKGQDCRLVLGSATPSLACLKLIHEGRLQVHQLSMRYASAGLPQVALVAMRDEKCQVGFTENALSAIQETVARQKRVLVFLNRRGYAPCVWCPTCDLAKACPGCDKPWTYHQAEQQLVCHRCQVSKPKSLHCDQCQQSSCIPLGQGTEKVALFLRERFPQVPVIKMDKDSCKTWRQLSSVLSEIHAPGEKIIVATQMMVKGHHIEDLDTVIVLGVDQSLRSKDFKAQEVLLAQMGQVIGRSGRGDTRGNVLIQTAYADHPLWAFVLSHNYEEAARFLLRQRAQYALPPFAAQVAMYFSGATAEKSLRLAGSVSAFVGKQFPQVAIIGPMPSLQAKLNGQHRMVIVMQSTSQQHMNDLVHALSHLRRQHKQAASMTIERDPVEL